jgi:hypothetical protein
MHERFKVWRLGGDRVALQCVGVEGSPYLSASGSMLTLWALRLSPTRGASEEFTVVQLGSGRVLLRSHSGATVTCDLGGGLTVRAAATLLPHNQELTWCVQPSFDGPARMVSPVACSPQMVSSAGPTSALRFLVAAGWLLAAGSCCCSYALKSTMRGAPAAAARQGSGAV